MIDYLKRVAVMAVSEVWYRIAFGHWLPRAQAPSYINLTNEERWAKEKKAQAEPTYEEKKKALAKKLASAMSKEIVGPSFGLTYSFWMARVLDESDFGFMYEMEAVEGAEACNKWMMDVLIGTGKYMVIDHECVQAVSH